MVLSTKSGISEKFREIQKTPLAKIGKKWRWSRTSAASYLQYLNPSMSAAHAENILSLYTAVEPCGLDLCATCLRYNTYIVQLDELQLLSPARSTESSATITKALSRYYRFILIGKDCAEPLVPTLGIELVWQSHMMLASRYASDMCGWIGAPLKRSQAARADQLLLAFERTSRKWESDFNLLYSTTGYFAPDSPSSLVRLATKVIPLQTRAALVGNIDYESPLIYSKVDTLLSQPCERNALIAVDLDQPARAREDRQRASIEHKLDRDIKLAERGFIDANLPRTASAMEIPFLKKARSCKFGVSNTGYPLGENGIIVTANEVSLSKLQEPQNVGRSFF